MTNKILSVLVTALIALTAHGQNESKWRLGLFFSPDYSEKTSKLFGRPQNPMYPNFSTTINSEKGLWTYSAGATIDRQFGQRLSIGTGLTYSTRGSHSVAFNEFYYGNRFYDDGKTITDWNYNGVSYLTKYYFIEIPLVFKYNLLSCNKLSLYPTVGFSTNYNFGMKNSTYVYYPDYTLIVNDKLSPGFGGTFFFSAIGGIGLDYKLNDKISLTLQPEYRRYLTFPTNEGVIAFRGYKQTLHSFGSKFGVTIKLK